MSTKDTALEQLDGADASLQELSTQLASIDVTLAAARDRYQAARLALAEIPDVVGFPPFEPIVLSPDVDDHTDQLNAELQRPGNYRYLPPGDYRINALRSARPRDGQLVVAAHTAGLHCIPHDQRTSNVLLIDDLMDVIWVGGFIVGDRLTHTYTPLSGTLGTHEWNHGLRVRKGNNVTVRDLAIRLCAGDGASIGGSDVTLDGVSCDQNRRNGITIGGSTRAKVLRCTSRRTGKMMSEGGVELPGAANGPWAGVDIEPDASGVVDALIKGCLIEYNQSSGVVALVRTGLKFDLQFGLLDNVFRDNSNGVESESQDGLRRIEYWARGNIFDRVRAQGFRMEAGTFATIGGEPGSKERNRFISRTGARADRELTGIPTLTGYTNDISKRTGATANVLTNWYE